LRWRIRSWRRAEEWIVMPSVRSVSTLIDHGKLFVTRIVIALTHAEKSSTRVTSISSCSSSMGPVRHKRFRSIPFITVVSDTGSSSAVSVERFESRSVRRNGLTVRLKFGPFDLVQVLIEVRESSLSHAVDDVSSSEDCDDTLRSRKVERTMSKLVDKSEQSFESTTIGDSRTYSYDTTDDTPNFARVTSTIVLFNRNGARTL